MAIKKQPHYQTGREDYKLSKFIEAHPSNMEDMVEASSDRSEKQFLYC